MRDVLRAGRSSRAGPVILVAIISLLLLSSFSVPAQGKTEEEWKGRTVYQIVSGTCHQLAPVPARLRMLLETAWPGPHTPAGPTVQRRRRRLHTPYPLDPTY